MRKFCTVVCIVLFLLGPTALQAKVIISEVMWMGSDISTSDEWLELASDDSESLSGWSIGSVKDGGTEDVIARFGNGASITAVHPIVVARWDTDRSRLAVAPALVAPNLTLPNTKLLLRLRDAAGRLMDEVDDGIGTPMAGANPSGGGTKATMERTGFDAPGNQPSGWRTATTTQGFDSGAPIFGTPGFTPFSPLPPPEEASGLQAMMFSGALHVAWTPTASASRQILSLIPSVATGSWILPASQTGFVLPNARIASGSSIWLQTADTAGMLSAGIQSFVLQEPQLRLNELSLSHANGSGAWVEIANLGASAIDLSGFSIHSGDSDIPITSSAPGSAVIQPNSFLALDVPEGISASDENISLRFADTVLDHIDLFDVPSGVSIGRSMGGVLVPLCMQTPGQDNQQEPLQGRIVIQSGTAPFFVGTPLSVRFDALSGSMADGTCDWDFDGDVQASACEPDPYVLSQTGTVFVNLEAKNYCGTTVQQRLSIEVLPGQAALQPPPPASPASGAPGISSIQSYPHITLAGALPNPVGKDSEGEWVELQNPDGTVGRMSGWWLVSGKTKYTFGDTLIQPGQTYRLALQGTKLVLGNTNGSVELHSPDGALVSKIAWNSAYEGRVYHQTVFGTSTVEAAVTRVIDGDTFTAIVSTSALGINKELTIRVLGIDTPELKPDTATYPIAIKAKENTSALILDKKVELQFDTEEQDVYGRYLAYVMAPGDVSLEQNLLQQGLAIVYQHAEIQRKAEYEGYQKQAQAQHVGLWALGAEIPKYSSEDDPKLTDAKQQNSKNSTGSIMSSNRAEIQISEIHSSIVNTKIDQKLFLRTEWVELYNPSSQDQDLKGWKLVEAASKRTLILPAETAIDAGKYLVIELHGSTLHLRDAGGILELHDPSGVLVSTVTYPALKPLTSFAYDSESGQYCVTSEITYGEENRCVDALVPVTKAAAASVAKPKKVATPKKTAAAKSPKSSPNYSYPEDRNFPDGSMTIGSPPSQSSGGGATAMGMGAFFGSLCSGWIGTAFGRVRKFVSGIA